MIANRIRYFNKHFLNRIMIRNAGSARSGIAILRHIGRRSGKTYEIPIIVTPMGEDFIFALTYGPKVDWYRNLLATGRGTLLWHGGTYEIGKPESIDRTTAMPHFPAFQRLILRLLDIQHFVRVKSTAPSPARA